MQGAENLTEGVAGRGGRNYSPLPPVSADVIREALIRGGSRAKAAKILGLARNTLSHRLAEIGEKSLVPREFNLAELKPEDWDKARPCWHCGKEFTPKRRQDWKSHFCTAEHRKLYHFTPASVKTQK